MNLLKNLVGAADKADEYIETSQERQETLSNRHKTDMMSDNKLSKMIRPLSLLVLLGVVSIVGISNAFGATPDPKIFGELVLLLGSAFGFYFDSRKREKIAFENAKANTKIEEMKLKSEILANKREAKRESRLKRKKLKNKES